MRKLTDEEAKELHKAISALTDPKLCSLPMLKAEDIISMRHLKGGAERTNIKVGGSSMFVSIFSEGYLKDPLCLMQLSMAILLDKPIILAVPWYARDKLPENLKKVATAIIHMDNDNDGKDRVVSEANQV